MKTLFQLNIILQVMWMLAIIAALFAPIFLLYIAFFMGINHLIFSTILLIGDGRKSKLKYHLVISIAYLILFYLVCTDSIAVLGINCQNHHDSLWVLGAVPPVLLAIHYWYVSFNFLNPFKSIEHNVFDL